MPNGKPHDNPITDLLIHGMHPFPPEIEVLIRELHKLDSHVLDQLNWAPFDWEKGKNLKEATVLLRGLIDSHGNPAARRQAIDAYHEKTK